MPPSPPSSKGQPSLPVHDFYLQAIWSIIKSTIQENRLIPFQGVVTIFRDHTYIKRPTIGFHHKTQENNTMSSPKNLFRYSPASQETTTVDGNDSYNEDSDGEIGNLTIAQFAATRNANQLTTEEFLAVPLSQVGSQDDEDLLISLSSEENEFEWTPSQTGVAVAPIKTEAEAFQGKTEHAVALSTEKLAAGSKRKSISPPNNSGGKDEEKRSPSPANGKTSADPTTTSVAKKRTEFTVRVSGRASPFQLIDNEHQMEKFDMKLHPHVQDFYSVPKDFKERGIQSDQCPAVVPKEFLDMATYPKICEREELRKFAFSDLKKKQKFVANVNQLLFGIPCSFRNSQARSVRQWELLSDDEKQVLKDAETDFYCFVFTYDYKVPVRLAVVHAFLHRLGNYRMSKWLHSYSNDLLESVDWDKATEPSSP